MELFTPYQTYNEAKTAAKDFYRSIDRIWCPALNDYISFTQEGFRHLVGKKGIVRPRSEQRRRFMLLYSVKDILENPEVKFSHTITTTRNLRADYWVATGIMNNFHIKIVIRKVDGGKKHFFSVYGKKQKTTPKSVDF
jgi:hypothetical protein